MAFEVVLSDQAGKFLTRIARSDRRLLGRIRRALHGLADNPFQNDGKLAGEKDLWKKRVGDYRIIFTVLSLEVRVCVIRIGHRREIYRE